MTYLADPYIDVTSEDRASPRNPQSPSQLGNRRTPEQAVRATSGQITRMANKLKKMKKRVRQLEKAVSGENV